jgi:flagellar motor switch protein FliG
MVRESLDSRKLTGAQKAAIFLMIMGEQYTSDMLKRMEQDEIGQIAAQMSAMDEVAITPDVMRQVVVEFIDKVESNQLMVQGETFLKTLVQLGLDQEKAGAIYKELEKGKRDIPFSYLEGLDINSLVGFIKAEHPQTIALILAHLRPQKAAEILSGLPPEIQGSVAMRVAEISQVPTEVIKELDLTLEKEVLSLGDSTRTKKLGGVTALADILNEVNKETEDNVLSVMEEERAEVAEEIKQLMYVFEDLGKLDDRAMREVLKQVETSQLAMALRTASEETKEKVFGNLSERAREMLREDMEVMGPVRLVEVERAQQNIVRVARELEGAGKIVLAKGKEEVFV